MRVLYLACAFAVVGCGEVVKTSPDADVDADVCASGTCECTAATESTDCGAHEYCNETATSRTCECVAGYTEDGDECVWTGVIEDPGFEQASAWTTVRGALVNPTAVGGQSPGEVSFIPSVLCDLPYVEQTFEMPAFDKSEPLVLELSYKSLADFDTGDRVLPGISLGASWTALPQQSSDSFQTVRVCLGERAYAPADTEGRGGPVTLELGPLNKPYSCPGSVGGVVFAIDHAQIVEAAEGECGDRPGVGPNHDAEGTSG